MVPQGFQTVGDYNVPQWLKPHAPKGAFCNSTMCTEFIPIVSFCSLKKVQDVFEFLAI
jgi:hypothetical protein